MVHYQSITAEATHAANRYLHKQRSVGVTQITALTHKLHSLPASQHRTPLRTADERRTCQVSPEDSKLKEAVKSQPNPRGRDPSWHSTATVGSFPGFEDAP